MVQSGAPVSTPKAMLTAYVGRLSYAKQAEQNRALKPALDFDS